MTESERSVTGRETVIFRRRFLAAAGSAAAVSVAGCSDITEQSFEAESVTLSSGDRGDLGLAETATDSQTITREIGDGVGEVTITSHFAAYSRADWLEED